MANCFLTVVVVASSALTTCIMRQHARQIFWPNTTIVSLPNGDLLVSQSAKTFPRKIHKFMQFAKLSHTVWHSFGFNGGNYKQLWIKFCFRFIFAVQFNCSFSKFIHSYWCCLVVKSTQILKKNQSRNISLQQRPSDNWWPPTIYELMITSRNNEKWRKPRKFTAE